MLQINGKKFHPLTFQYIINETENYFQDDITEYLEKLNISGNIKLLHSDNQTENNTDNDSIASSDCEHLSDNENV